VLPRELAEVVVELVEYDEWVVELISAHREYLLPVGGVDREDPLQGPLHDPYPQLGPVDVVVLAEQVEGLLRIRVKDVGDDYRLEPVVRLALVLFCRVSARYVSFAASAISKVNLAPANSPVPVFSQETL